ncbi:MAG: imelysin family protein [Winogradskyella sp.]|uniref:imelysin family protein n=1 Tax=Winogradskyella sp. TaxID=1883156 RepID=UPI001826A912|nr:imelysin family protein [Winogradskyella sp.]MBT8244843.1 imelysin family protein [Winogradskyella sp.]NNK21801.1 imelysin family protein [Winogradskyella sp.]
MKSLKFIFLVIILCCVGIYSCSDDESLNANNTGNFDRQAMLVNWVDDLIIPAYQDFNTKVTALKSASNTFESLPNQTNLNNLRQTWEDAYITWQNVSMFNIGPAQSTFLRSFLNIYPTNAGNIDANISSGNYALQDINRNDEQGFPALDYLLFGLADTDTEILEFYTTNTNANSYLAYLTDVVNRIDTLTNEVVTEWEGDYRATFVNSSGNAANSSTNVLVNEYMKYYEVFFRNGKIGTPAGVFSAGMQTPEKVEAFYKKDLSKTLCLEALDALQNFFRGTVYNQTTTVESLESYLDFLNTMKEGEDLSLLINNQFNTSRDLISALNSNFFEQINTNNIQMLEVFEALQDNVVFLKSDMMSALNINIAFESNDGD